jgi:hypothetical protein
VREVLSRLQADATALAEALRALLDTDDPSEAERLSRAALDALAHLSGVQKRAAALIERLPTAKTVDASM